MNSFHYEDKPVNAVEANNCKRHINTLCGENSEVLKVKTGSECDNHCCFALQKTKMIYSSYLTENSVFSKDKSVKDVYRNDGCFLYESYGEFEYLMWAKFVDFTDKTGGTCT